MNKIINLSFKSIYITLAGRRKASFAFALWVVQCERGKSKCGLCVQWLKIKLKKVREGKNKKIQKDRQRAVRLVIQWFAAVYP